MSSPFVQLVLSTQRNNNNNNNNNNNATRRRIASATASRHESQRLPVNSMSLKEHRNGGSRGADSYAQPDQI